MGVPVDRAASDAADTANPVGTDGLAFIEFSAVDPAPLADLFARLGFVRVAALPNRPVSLWRQGDIHLLLNSESASHGGRFASAHGPCVSAIAFRVADASAALDHAVGLGACAYDGGPAKTVDAAAIVGIGDSLLYFIDDASRPFEAFAHAEGQGPQAPCSGVGLVGVDHLTHNVAEGNLEVWCDFYRRIFNFREVYYLDARGRATGFRTRAMKSPCGKICIPINEPSDPKSQIQEYIDLYKGEGVQHVALAASDICDSVEALIGQQIDFVSIPDSYYSEVDARLPGHGEDTLRLARDGILIDGDRTSEGDGWALLLQVFSRPLVGPIFFELIQRKGNDGFGDGNAKALFEALERDQIDRGVV